MPNLPVISLRKIPQCYGSDCITLGIAYANDYDEMIDYLEKNLNKTQTVVLFCTGHSKFQKLTELRSI